MMEIYDMDDYQRLAKRTKEPTATLDYLVHGLASEAGEVAGVRKRMIRDDGDELTVTRRAEMLSELGDCLWYVAMLADRLDTNLSEVASTNIAKLFDRKARGVIRGKGGNR